MSPRDAHVARWLEGPVARVRRHVAMYWPLRSGPQYREYSMVALFGDVELEPGTLHAELLAPPALAPHHLAQAHAQVRASLDEYVWEVGVHGIEPWPEALHRCRSTGNWYSALPWCEIDPTEDGRRRSAEERRRAEAHERTVAANLARLGLSPPAESPAPPIPTHCPRCAVPTVHDDALRVFRCPACGWHD